MVTSPPWLRRTKIRGVHLFSLSEPLPFFHSPCTHFRFRCAARPQRGGGKTTNGGEDSLRPHARVREKTLSGERRGTRRTKQGRKRPRQRRRSRRRIVACQRGPSGRRRRDPAVIIRRGFVRRFSRYRWPSAPLPREHPAAGSAGSHRGLAVTTSQETLPYHTL